MTNFWDNIQSAKFDNEASVETNLIIPLLYALGYNNNDICSKYPLVFQEGRKGRKPEADYVVFYGPVQDKNTSLIVVEAKAPGESFGDAKRQGESYASNIRAPFLLLTDGINLEIWQLQPTQESECILQTPVQSLCTVQGQIERYLGKEAACEYCRSLPSKSILTATEDFSAYEAAELNRTAQYQPFIERTLSEKNQGNPVISGQLLFSYPNGAVILAPSGLGKTTLSYALLRKSIENRQSSESTKLPFDLPLPDLAETDISVFEFMKRRITAYHPGITDAYLNDLLCNKGAILLCDGFDRLSAQKQRQIEAQLRNLRRDFASLQLFVFSRGSKIPELNLSVLELKPLTVQQQREFSESFNLPLYRIPDALSELCSHPLLLRQILEYWQSKTRLPTRIEELFRSWLDGLLLTDFGQDVGGIYREAALTLLAKETTNGPINKIRVLTLLKEHGFSDETFSQLLSCDAIRISGSVIELQHEALADYLRASDIITSDENKITQLVSEISLEDDSFFPVLLMALLPSRNLQKILWKRLAHIGINAYFDSLRYRADVSGEMISATPEDFAFQYLEDLIEGVEFPLNGFFPQIQDVVIEQLIKTSNCEMAVTGWIDLNSAHVTFGFHPKTIVDKKIIVGDPPAQYESYGVNLKLSEYRLDSGRLLGAKHLEENLLEIIANRRLKGGKIWASERLIGRLRYMEKICNFPLNEIDSLDALEAILKPDAKKTIFSTYPVLSPKFHVKELLEDITFLKSHEQNALDFWWLTLGWKNAASTGDNVMQKLLDEHFRRLQLVYKEIVENSFQSISDQFGFYPALPIRWDCVIVKTGDISSLHQKWFPVSFWNEIGANVEFSEITPTKRFKGFGRSELSEALTKLGRTECHGFMGSAGSIPNFGGYDWRGCFTGETTVVARVCELISSDVKNFLSSMPDCD